VVWIALFNFTDKPQEVYYCCFICSLLATYVARRPQKVFEGGSQTFFASPFRLLAAKHPCMLRSGVPLKRRESVAISAPIRGLRPIKRFWWLYCMPWCA